MFGITSITYPDGTTHFFTYDEVGNLSTKQDGHGITSYLYDANMQLIEIQHPDQTTTQFTYDFIGNRLSVSNENSIITYVYDNRNRLLSTTQEVDGIFYTISYEYDAASRLVSITYPDQTVIANTYDDLNRLTSIEEYALFTYTPDSFVDTITYANGVVTTFSYDQCHRPLSISAEKAEEVLLSMGYTYDLGGNITEIARDWIDPIAGLPQTATESYTYDALDRVMSASNGFGMISYEYDAAGNRIQQIKNGQKTDYTYSSYNRLATAGDWTFTYDGNGNTTSKISVADEWVFQYNTRDELMQVEQNAEIKGTYLYDGEGHRIKKTEWNQASEQYETIVYVYSGGNICYEKNITTGLYALYMYSPTGRISKKVGDETMYYHTDHLGSTRLLTDATGEPMTSVGYHPFGYPDISGDNEQYLFTGQEMDSTGLYYYKARYYDPEIGRFLTEDAWGGDYKRPQTLNKYIYCLNNPLKYTDPTGNNPGGRGPVIDPDELPTIVIPDDPEEENSDEEIDWEEIGKILGFYTGIKIAENLVDENLGTNYQNSYAGITQKSLAIYQKIYNLENDDENWKKFEQGFMEGVNKGMLHKAENVDIMFADLGDEVQELITTVNEVVVISLATELLVPIPAELYPEAWAVAKSASAAHTLATAIDNIPDAGFGAYLVVFGLVISIIVQRRKKRAECNKKQSKRGRK